MAPDYPSSLAQLGKQDPALATELAELSSLEKVLAWLHRKDGDLAGVESIVQDEYSHDVIMPLPDGRWLAFAVT
jgi:hypothetical protein